MSRISPLFSVCRFPDAIVYQRPEADHGVKLKKPRRIASRGFWWSTIRRWCGSTAATCSRGPGSRSSRPSTASKPWRRCWRSPSIWSSSTSTCRGWTAFRFCARCGAARRTSATLPALVITTEAGQQDIDDARAAGANFYLVKPVSEADLLRHAARAHGGRRMNALHEQFITEARELVQQATDDLDRGGTRRALAGADRSRVSRLPYAQGLGRRRRAAGDGADAACRRRPAGGDPGRARRRRPRRRRSGAWPASIRSRTGWMISRPTRPCRPTPAKIARAMAERLRALAARQREQAGSRIGAGRKPAAGALPEWAYRLIESRSATISRAPRETAPALLAISYEPRRRLFLQRRRPARVDAACPGPAGVSDRAARSLARRLPSWTLMPAICACAASRREISAELAAIFRLVPDQVRIVEVPAQALRPEQAERPRRRYGRLIRSVLDEQCQMLRGRRAARTGLPAASVRPPAVPPTRCVIGQRGSGQNGSSARRGCPRSIATKPCFLSALDDVALASLRAG